MIDRPSIKEILETLMILKWFFLLGYTG